MSSCCIATVSCNEDYVLEDLSDFTLEAPSVVKVGQPVTFTIGGDPDMIMFYSGEFQHVFAGRDCPTVYPARMSVSFSTEVSVSSTPGMNPERMYLKYSTDFSGIYTTEEVLKATWTDISDRFIWPTQQGETVGSGEVSVDDIFPADGSPLYFMLDYRVTAFDDKKQPNGRVQWINKNFVINGGTDLLVAEMYNHFTLGWQIVGLENYDRCDSNTMPQMPTESKLRIAFRTQFKPEVDIEFAAISCPVSSAGGITIRDTGMSVKTAQDPHLPSFTYVYNQVGEYDATFAGINANHTGSIEIPRTVHLKVIEDNGYVQPVDKKEWK